MFVKGIVIRGKSEGRKLGFPTANVLLAHKGEVKSGVYKGIAHLEVQPPSGLSGPAGEYLAALFVDEKEEILEAHILDFEGDLYGKEIEVEIKEKIRDTIP